MRSIKKNISYLFAAKMSGFIFGMVDSIVISRYLGPEHRGIYILILLVNYMVVNFSNCGLDYTNTYLLAKLKNTIEQVHSHSIVLIVIVSILVYLLYAVLRDPFHANFLKQVSPTQIMIALGLVPFSLYLRFWGAMMAGFERFKLTSVLNICTGFINTLVICLIMIMLKGGVNELLMWMLSSFILFSLIRIIILKINGELGFDFSWQRFRDALIFGMKGHVGNIATHIIYRFDNFVLNFFHGPAGVGIYSLSVSLVEKVKFIPEPILSATAPRISSLKSFKSAKLTALLVRHTLLISLLLSLLLFMTVPWLLPLIYGFEYSDSVIPLLIMLPGIIAMLMGMGFSSFITLQLGKPHIMSIVSWCNLAVTLPMMFFMIRSYGVVGAAVTTTVSYLLIVVVNTTLFLKLSGESFRLLVPCHEDFKVYLSIANKVYRRTLTVLNGAKRRV